MNICLIGYSIPSLLLANILTDKNIKISIFAESKLNHEVSSRTLGVTKRNIEFLKKNKINIENISWPINNIKIFNKSSNKKEILKFESAKNKLFSIIKNHKFFDLLKKKIKKKKIKKILINI